MLGAHLGVVGSKFYVIQVVESKGKFYAWNRWGRVGEPGQNSLSDAMAQAEAEKAFEKKFSDKTKNKWADRGSFKAVAGKYTLIEIDHSTTAAAAESKLLEKAPVKMAVDATPSDTQYADSKLSEPVRLLMELIFSK